MMLKLGFIATLLTISIGAAPVPVLLELFTSEGCSSCPPADKLLALLDQHPTVAGAELIVLSEHVDYWDSLGWKDRFSSSQYTARQQQYASKLSLDVYTPQLVVDGAIGFVGSNRSQAESAIKQAIQTTKIPVAISGIARGDGQITAHVEIAASTKRGRAAMYVAIAEESVLSQVGSGENAGHALPHVAVARVLKQIGTVEFSSGVSKQVSVPIPAGMKAVRIVAFLQDSNSGRILGVAGQKVSP